MFSPSGQVVVTVSGDGTRIWDVASGECLHMLEGHRDRVQDTDFSSDGHKLLTASEDCTARIWDVSSGKCLCTLEGHASTVWSAQFSPDDQEVLTASEDG